MNKLIRYGAMGLLLLAAACKRNDDDPVAGKGGNATLRIVSQHHKRTIDSITVYIKYNASNFPSAFDDSAAAVKNTVDTVAVFSNLKKGSYYLYGIGWDRSIGDTVFGGVPYTVTEEKTINLFLPVTEGD